MEKRMSENRPNVLFIMSDQHSKAVAGCYDHDIVQTPHMDRLAQRGLTYDNAFCASPLCGPSRVASRHTHNPIPFPFSYGPSVPSFNAWSSH